MKRLLLAAALVAGLVPTVPAQVPPLPPVPPVPPAARVLEKIKHDAVKVGTELQKQKVALKLAEEKLRLTESTVAEARERALEAVKSAEWSRAMTKFGGYPHSTREREEQVQSPDSLWAQGRAALNRGAFTQAAELFSTLWRRHPRSSYAGDALYWEAFARRRLGSTANLRSALDRLDRQARDYKEAATRGDAQTLATTIRGELARRGDARAAEQVAAIAAGCQPGVPCPPSPTPATPPVPPRAAQAPQPPQPTPAPSPGSTRPGRRNTPVAGCPVEEDDERIAALNALQQMDSDLAMPILKKVLAKREPCSETLRRKAVFLVAQQKSPERADLLLEAARSDPDREVKQNAVFWMGQVRDERSVTILSELMRSSDDYELQERAIYALSQHRSEGAGAALRAYAQQESAPVDLRSRAIFWLAQQRPAENAPFLRELYAKLQDEALKEQVLQGLSQTRDPANSVWLLGIAQSSNEPIKMRTKALFWAAQSRDVPLTDFTGLYDRVTDEEMKEQLIFAFAQRKESAAVDKLMDIARKDPNRELRAKAIFWLGQSKDPRIAKFFEDLISQ